MSEPAFVAETLAWCNERRALNKEAPLAHLPKGRRHAAISCPCGAATGLYVYRDVAEDEDGEIVCEVPGAVSDFVLAFDRGELPQYDAEMDDEGQYFDVDGNGGMLDEVNS